MQQLTTAQLLNTHILVGKPNILICDFEYYPDWEAVNSVFTHWLNQNEFMIKETIEGADRISWRLELNQQSFYFNYEELSESAWFETEDTESVIADNQTSGVIKAIMEKLSR